MVRSRRFFVAQSQLQCAQSTESANRRQNTQTILPSCFECRTFATERVGRSYIMTTLLQKSLGRQCFQYDSNKWFNDSIQLYFILKCAWGQRNAWLCMQSNSRSDLGRTRVRPRVWRRQRNKRYIMFYMNIVRANYLSAVNAGDDQITNTRQTGGKPHSLSTGHLEDRFYSTSMGFHLLHAFVQICLTGALKYARTRKHGK